MKYQKSAEEGRRIIVAYIMERMNEMGVSAYWLARETGLAESTLSRFFHEQADIGLTNFLKICGALKLRPYLVPAEMDQDEIKQMYFNWNHSK